MEIYKNIADDFVFKLRPSNVDDSSFTSIIILEKPKYMQSVNINNYPGFKEKYKELDKQIFTNFINRNKSGLQFEKLNFTGIEILKVKNDSLVNWTELSSKHPHLIFSIFEFSNIGFNEDRTQALVYYSYVSGSHSGGGFYFIYKKKRKKWKRKKIIPSRAI